MVLWRIHAQKWNFLKINNGKIYWSKWKASFFYEFLIIKYKNIKFYNPMPLTKYYVHMNIVFTRNFRFFFHKQHNKKGLWINGLNEFSFISFVFNWVLHSIWKKNDEEEEKEKKIKIIYWFGCGIVILFMWFSWSNRARKIVRARWMHVVAKKSNLYYFVEFKTMKIKQWNCPRTCTHDSSYSLYICVIDQYRSVS